VVEIILAVFLFFCAAVVVIVAWGFTSDAPRDSPVGIAIFSWLIAIALSLVAIVLYKRSIRRLSSIPKAWSVVEIALAVLLMFCAGVVAILGFAASEGGPHAFPGDVRLGIVCWLVGSP
jgi:drug/metabolite transporter (DMT)-like permease